MVSIPNYLYRADKTARVAICVPVRDNVTAAFSFSLAMLLKKCGETARKTSLHMVIGSEIASQRQQLATEALSTECTHILWLDSDMRFPNTIIESLLLHEKDIVACNYSTRVAPHIPVAFTSKQDMSQRLYDQTGLNKVTAVGMGCMLVKRNVFNDMELPYFGVEWNHDYTSLIGEDLFFANKADNAGYDIWIDSDLSNKIAHIGTRAYTLEDDCK
jgi:hypothetical protein